MENQQTATRWVRKNRRIYTHSLCQHCGAAGGCGEGCRSATCLWCGTVQCSSNGLGNGTCSVCYHGMLEGWLGSQGSCKYKGCLEQAVTRTIPRKGRVCANHAERILPGYRDARIAERAKSWIEINV